MAVTLPGVGLGTAGPGKSVALSADEQSYAAIVQSGSGLDPSVVAAWIACESGPNQTKGDHNYLNIGPGRAYPSVQAAAQDVIATLHNGLYPGVLAAAGQAPAAQIAALKASPWDAGHYANGCLENTLGTPASGTTQATDVSFLSDLGNILGGVLGTPFGSITSGLSAANTLLGFIGSLFTWQLWRRVLSVGGGVVLILIGLGIVYRDAFGDVAAKSGRIAELAGVAAA